MELDRVRPDVDHRVARRAAGQQCRETDRIARVDVAAETDRADRRDHGRRVLVLDRDRPDRLSVRGDVGDFRGAAAGRIADPSLVDRDRADRAAGPSDLGEEAIETFGRLVGWGDGRRSAPVTIAMSAGAIGKATLATGSHRSRPSGFTSRSVFTSMRSKRIFTTSVVGCPSSTSR